MASRQQIKQRIGTVKNTKQITKAMQMVAASKLRRAQDAAAGPRAYSALARTILSRLRHIAGGGSEFHLFAERPVKNRLLLVVTGDRGLAGAYNSNVIRRMFKELQEDQQKGIKTSVIVIGRQAANAVGRIKDLDIHAAYQGLPDRPDADTLRPILTTIVGLFADRTVDAVDIINTKFVSTIVQEVQVQRLLPAGLEPENAEEAAEDYEAEVEPSPEVLLQSVTLRLLDAQIYQALLEAAASEHSMRMLAMKNATDNATDIIDDLTLEFNNARQAAITQELAEITGGAEAMK